MKAQSQSNDEQRSSPDHGTGGEQHSGHGSDSALARLHSQEKAKSENEPKESGRGEIRR